MMLKRKKRDKVAQVTDNDEIAQFKQELDALKTVFLAKWPFLYSILRRCRIIADTNIPTAGVNIKNEMRVNPMFMRQLDTKAKVFVYAHETLHIGFSHPDRGDTKDGNVFNIAADSVVNTILREYELEDVSFPFEIVTAEKVSSLISKKEEDVSRMSAEEQYYWLMKCGSTLQSNVMRDITSCGERKDNGSKEEDSDTSEDKEEVTSGSNKRADSGSDEEDLNGSGQGSAESGEQVIQEGDPEAYSSDKTPEETEEYWRNVFIQALVQAKMAGKLPLGVERILEDFLKSKVDWKSLIKKQILDGLGRSVVSSWKRPSRKHPMVPGIKHLTKPNVWFLVDTSGSISNEELQQFFGEMYSVLRNQGKGIIIPWDAGAYDKIELTSAKDLAYRIRDGSIKGGGGTVIGPALAEVIKSGKRGDVVVVLTDGDIFDIGNEDTQALLQKVGFNSSSAVFGTTHTDVSLPIRWRKVKIEV